MSGRVARFMARPGREKWALVEAAAVLSVAAVVVAVVPFARIARWSGRPVRGAVRPGEERTRAIADISRAVVVAARYVPLRAKCFEQGIAAQWMLRRRGVATTLHYGVARAPERNLAAHVWVSAGPLDVVGCTIREDYAELARFPRQ